MNTLFATSTYVASTNTRGARVKVNMGRFQFTEVVPFKPHHDSSLDVFYEWAYDHGYIVKSHGILSNQGKPAVYAYVLETNRRKFTDRDKFTFKHPNE